MLVTDKSFTNRRIDHDRQWRSLLAISVGGLFLFETISGLYQYLLPFSVPSQVMVLMHTLMGLPFGLLVTWYGVTHWSLYRRLTLNPIKLAGYASLLTIAGLVVSGGVLTWQAALGPQIGPVWDILHVILTFVAVAVLAPHLLQPVLRDRTAATRMASPLTTVATTGPPPSLASAPEQEESTPSTPAENGMRDTARSAGAYGLGSLAVASACLLGVAVWVGLYRPPVMHNTFPPGYTYQHGGPFAPSLATTASGGAYDATSLGGSKACGRCHQDIYNEWSVSAHRWSSMDSAFQAIQSVMAKENGPASTRYCGGCHDPISLFSGTKNILTRHLTSLVGYQEGISCLVCHAIKKTDVNGNANYTITQPPRYMYELQDGQMAATLSDFLIRAYPGEHIATLSKRMFKTPEFCAACHKQFIDKQVNHMGWVQLQNQYDNWRKSHWNHPGHPAHTIECRECHMPLLANRHETQDSDPGDYNRTPYDGRHRSHRFLGANQFMPVLLQKSLPGWKEQVRLVNAWLQGKIQVPEIAKKWRSGPAVRLRIIAPTAVAEGGTVPLTVVVISNKVGHDYPTGPLDIIQSWIELTVRDDTGRMVYQSGALDGQHFIKKGAFIFRAEPVDENGNLIERHNLWDLVGVRYKRSIFPGFSDRAPFTFSCPGQDSAAPISRHGNYKINASATAVGHLHVEARLCYRKMGQFLVNFIYGKKSGVTAPVTVLSTATWTITVAPGVVHAPR